MNDFRYKMVNRDPGHNPLTAAEEAAGWHFCDEWDDLLVGPGMIEFAFCLCCGLGKNGAAARAHRVAEKNKLDENQTEATLPQSLLL